jgi:UDPglucose--hexose-1-phosphate uridylyltransferase
VSAPIRETLPLVAHRSEGRLADGRSIVYFDDHEGAPSRLVPDLRTLPTFEPRSELRYDPLLDTWVVVATHRQGRSYHPPSGDCPLCPSAPGHLSEIPAPSYDVAVFENRFPALAPEEVMGAAPALDGLLARRPGYGHCEVVCFTEDHTASFVDLSLTRVTTVLGAWIDRSVALAALPGTVQVYCFENRGEEIGVTLEHPHGQIYAYPFVTARTAKVLGSVRDYGRRTGGNLFDDVLAAELADGRRVVVRNRSWVGFVPHAARWPYEVHLYPLARVPDLASLDAAACADFAEVYLELLRRFDAVFGERVPYISAWHQAPMVPGREDFALHLELFTARRAPGRLKYQAGTESGMDAFSNDVLPEIAARRLRAATPITGS